MTKQNAKKEYKKMLKDRLYFYKNVIGQPASIIAIAGWADARFLCKRYGKIKPVGKGNNTKLKICASCKRKGAGK